MILTNMTKNILSVKEIEHKDINFIADYWFNSDKEYLLNMGVDVEKLPAREDFVAMLKTQITLPYNEKKVYGVVWYVDDKPIGHSNLNPLVYNDNGYMHLHIWYQEYRNKGYGIDFIKMSTAAYFNNLKLKKLYCQPNAFNPSPNKTLEKAGFKFVKEYITTPGSITFEQAVKLWEVNEAII